MVKRIVILPPQSGLTRAWAAELSTIDGLEVDVAEDRESAARFLVEADAAYGTLDPGLLASATRLEWLQAPMAAPPAGYFFDELVAHPVVVTNFRGIYNDHVATHALALILALARGLHRYGRQQVDAVWERHLGDHEVVHLPESTALVIGVGAIGAEIARLLSAFGVRTLGVDPQRTDAPEGVVSMHSPAELDSLLPEADLVILTLPHTPESQGLIGERRISLMRPDAVLVNVGRGETIELDAVVDALRQEKLRGVGLDVFETEPLPAAHPIWREPRAIVTPHVAVVGPYIDDRRLAVLRRNAEAFVAATPLQNVVDKALWY